MTITQLYDEARDWIKDALIEPAYEDYDLADDLDRAGVRSLIDDNWDGGWRDFVNAVGA